jgi:hypothetical protein
MVMLFRITGKILFSYTKGFSFGYKYTRLAIKAVNDFRTKKMGLVMKPGAI